MKETVRTVLSVLGVALAVGVLSAYIGDRSLLGETHFGFSPEVWTGILGAGTVLTVFVFYKITSRVIGSTIIKHGGKEGDLVMVTGFWRFVVVFAAALALLTVYFGLGTVATVVGAFGGMFLGWSLQQPVSGFAAWFLMSAKRPFRVGDRVQLPSYGLVGDVTDVGPMYTVLNQVGGAVGSEEPVGRDILIPNAMLFANLVINYTPPPHHVHPMHLKREIRAGPAHILDEIVVRITFDSNWSKAEVILLKAAREVTADIIKETGQDPYIRADFYDYGVWLRLRYVTLATDRPRVTYEITKRVYQGFSENEDVDFAIPYVYSCKGRPRWSGSTLVNGQDLLKNQASVPLQFPLPAGVALGKDCLRTCPLYGVSSAQGGDVSGGGQAGIGALSEIPRLHPPPAARQAAASAN